MSMTSTMTKPSELKAINNNLKMQIKEVIAQSSILLSTLNRKKYLSKIKTKSSLNSKSIISESNVYLLNDLPLDQQISIYKNSIGALRNKLEKESKIMKIENEIKVRNETLYHVKEENKKIKNLYNLNVKKYDNYEAEKDIQKELSEMEEKVKIEKEKYKDLRQEEKNLQMAIKTQNNEMFFLSTKCNFIKENISLKRNKKTQVNIEELSKEIDELINKVNTIKANVTIYKNGYENEIQSQQNKINTLQSDISLIQKKINSFTSQKKVNEYFMKAKMNFIKMSNYNINSIKNNTKNKRPISSNYKKLNISITSNNNAFKPMKTTGHNTNKSLNKFSKSRPQLQINRSFIISKQKNFFIENIRSNTDIKITTELPVAQVTKVNTVNTSSISNIKVVKEKKKNRSLTPIRVSSKITSNNKLKMSNIKRVTEKKKVINKKK